MQRNYPMEAVPVRMWNGQVKRKTVTRGYWKWPEKRIDRSYPATCLPIAVYEFEEKGEPEEVCDQGGDREQGCRNCC